MEKNSPFTTQVGSGTEGQHITAAWAYRSAIAATVTHQVGDKQIEVPPINREEVLPVIIQSLEQSGIWEDKGTPTVLNPQQRERLAEIGCNLAVRLSKTYCGAEAEEKSDRKFSDREAIGAEIARLFNAIVQSFSSQLDDAQTFRCLAPFKGSIVDNVEISLHRAARSIFRGLEAARNCKVCEQVDAVVGAQIHIASALLALFLDPDRSQLLQKLVDEYLTSSVTETANPAMVIAVDAMIVTVSVNPSIFRQLYMFFGSVVEIDGKKMTYFDMVQGLYT